MNHSSNLQTSRFICLLIAIAAACCSLASKADDAATATAPEITNTPAPAVTPETTPAPETTNAPAPAVAPETTPVPEATNTPATAAAPAITNTPAPATVPVTTNAPATTTTSLTTNQPAVAAVPAATNAPAATPLATTATAKTKPAVTRKATPSYRPFSIDAEAGTTGYGGAATWRFADHLGVRAGLDYFQYSFSANVQDAKYNLRIHLMSEPLALDLFPSRNSTFHLSLGALINQNQFTGANGSAQNITINGSPYFIPANALSLKLKQPAVLPYASLGGNLYLGSRHHLFLSGELGAAYGRWNASFTDSSGISASDLAAEKSKVQNGANKVPVWPIIKIGIGYSF